MIKDQDYLKSKASYCLDIAKKNGATDASVMIGHSISETVNFRNKNLDESNRSDDLAFNINIYIGKKKSSISSSNMLNDNLKSLLKNKDISEDDNKNSEKNIQKLTDINIEKIEKILVEKEKEMIRI